MSMPHLGIVFEKKKKIQETFGFLDAFSSKDKYPIVVLKEEEVLPIFSGFCLYFFLFMNFLVVVGLQVQKCITGPKWKRVWPDVKAET